MQSTAAKQPSNTIGNVVKYTSSAARQGYSRGLLNSRLCLASRRRCLQGTSRPAAVSARSRHQLVSFILLGATQRTFTRLLLLRGALLLLPAAVNALRRTAARRGAAMLREAAPVQLRLAHAGCAS